MYVKVFFLADAVIFEIRNKLVFMKLISAFPKNDL